MIEVFQASLNWFRDSFDMFLSDGGYVGMAIVFFPIFRLLIRAVRSIIKKN